MRRVNWFVSSRKKKEMEKVYFSSCFVSCAFNYSTSTILSGSPLPLTATFMRSHIMGICNNVTMESTVKQLLEMYIIHFLQCKHNLHNCRRVSYHYFATT